MTNKAFQHDVGAYITSRAALNPEVVTTTGDGSERNGTAIDRNALNSVALSAIVTIPYYGALAAAKTVTIKSNVQHSSVSSAGWADYNDKDNSTANTVTAGSTATTAAQTPSGVLEYDVDLAAAKRYVRVQVTPTLSATATDTVDIAGVIVFGGGGVLPIS